MAAKAERLAAVATADRLCPRCGTKREFDQHYCLECGMELPVVQGTIAAFRRRWIRWFGWYPGDFVWLPLLALLVAGAGAAAAIVVAGHRTESQSKVITALHGPVPLAEPQTVSTAVATPAVGDTSTLPTAPEPGAAGSSSKKGRTVWPRNATGWTVVIVSYPKLSGSKSALDTATKAAKSGLRQVGVLDSDNFASLQPGYFVVFAGVYGSKDDADAAVATVRQAGFGGSYTRQISR
jgi:hypothetical protein